MRDLNPSETRKYEEWYRRVVDDDQDPNAAVDFLGYSKRKLQGADNQWEFYVGAYMRVSYTVDSKTLTATVVAVGHTR